MGAAAFTQSLGTGARWFLESLYGQDEYTRYCAEERIVSSGIAMAGVASGGVLHYRRCYPEDPYLRLWSGLILLGLGRPALAVGELQQAIGLGLASWRFWAHLATAASAANADVLARTATAEALRGDPHSAWAARHTFR